MVIQIWCGYEYVVEIVRLVLFWCRFPQTKDTVDELNVNYGLIDVISFCKSYSKNLTMFTNGYC